MVKEKDMTKQEDIEEATKVLEAGGCIHVDPSLCQLDGDCVTCYLKFLVDKGCVLKVDGELPRVISNGAITGLPWEVGFEEGVTEEICRIKEAGYIKTKPLIKEQKSDGNLV